MKLSRAKLISLLAEKERRLMDFQKASVAAVYSGIFEGGRRRMLLADEVGLGKTVVAGGLLARILRERVERGVRRPLRVTYICSNQILARENLRKIDPFPDGVTRLNRATRLALLAFPDTHASEGDRTSFDHWSPLELTSLTPATSFELGSSLGDRKERKAIFATLCQCARFRNQAAGLKWILRGSIGARREEFFAELDSLAKDSDAVRPGLATNFIKLLRNETVDPDAPETKPLLEALPRRREGRVYSLYEAVLAFAERTDGRNRDKYRLACNYVVQRLRRHLVDCCVRFLNADIFILDEFQRFQNLLSQDEDDVAASIARRIFALGRRDSPRVLLLSATPFKAFTTDLERDQGEDHFREFGRVLDFLIRDRPEELKHYEHHRRALHRQLLALHDDPGLAGNSEHRDAVQRILRSVICRTERRHAASRLIPLVEDRVRHEEFQPGCSRGDIENYRRTDAVARALERIGVPVGRPIEFCKAAPFPLSFLDRYRFKEALRENRHRDEIRAALRGSAGAWIDRKAIHRYAWNPGALSNDPETAHARLSLLIRHAIGDVGERLLWVPPSLPYYPPTECFAGSEHFSKTLLFSAWRMAPRAVAALLSYEVERRTIARRESITPQEQADQRRYFHREKHKRHPLPQLRFHFSGESISADLTLLYPSPFLTAIVDPVVNLTADRPAKFSELIERTTLAIEARLKEMDLSRWITSEGSSDRWYWAAAPLLDHLSGGPTSEALLRWARQSASAAITGKGPLDEQDDAYSGDSVARVRHFEALVRVLEDPASSGLGPPPEDLASTLALLALGSPAVVALRGLRRLIPRAAEPDEYSTAITYAGCIADAFRVLYNKPESVAAIRLVSATTDDGGSFWRQAASYAAECCLQATVDEYLHLLLGQSRSIHEAVTQFADSLKLHTSSINVDDLGSFLAPEGAPRANKMRCHYAVEFGQRMETDKGQNRAADLRQVFNSPFRPFVLATTSIGQEGLDFHAYCRRIVHWNLPTNPVDFEQREGRINRFRSLAIRQLIARKYRDQLAAAGVSENEDPWEKLFTLAECERTVLGGCDLIPSWHVDSVDGPKIERIVPLYPFSVDWERLQRMLRTLTLYRLAFGQPRQSDLIDHLLNTQFSSAQMEQLERNLLIDLRPADCGS